MPAPPPPGSPPSMPCRHKAPRPATANPLLTPHGAMRMVITASLRLAAICIALLVALGSTALKCICHQQVWILCCCACAHQTAELSGVTQQQANSCVSPPVSYNRVTCLTRSTAPGESVTRVATMQRMESPGGLDASSTTLAQASSKVYRGLLPLLCLVAALCYIDRTNLAFASFTMTRDLNFSPSVYGAGSGLFFAG